MLADEVVGGLDFSFLQEESRPPILEHGLRDGMRAGDEFGDSRLVFFAVELASVLEVVLQPSRIDGRRECDKNAPQREENPRRGQDFGKKKKNAHHRTEKTTPTL